MLTGRPSRTRRGADLARPQLTIRLCQPQGYRGRTPLRVAGLRPANPPNGYRSRGLLIARQLSWDPIPGRRNRHIKAVVARPYMNNAPTVDLQRVATAP